MLTRLDRAVTSEPACLPRRRRHDDSQLQAVNAAWSACHQVRRHGRVGSIAEAPARVVWRLIGLRSSSGASRCAGRPHLNRSAEAARRRMRSRRC
jgi:hypothetical protein